MQGYDSLPSVTQLKGLNYEVAQLAGQIGWYVFRDGLLDCDFPASNTPRKAWYRLKYSKPANFRR